MKKSNVLFVSGIPNDSLVQVVSIQSNTNTKYIMTGSANIYVNIDDERINKRYQKLDLSQKQKINLNNIDILFNQIADPDSHSKVLSKVKKFIENKKDLIVINHPKNVLDTSRNRIYTNLHKIDKLKVPKTVKIVPMNPQSIEESINKYSFKYPIILRKSGTHGGDSVKLIKSSDDIYKLYDVALDGSIFYLIQFIDYKEDNIYKKFRLAVIDGEVYIRHAIFSDDWMIHARSKDSKYKNEELEFLNSFEDRIKKEIQATIDEIYKRIKLDYFGMDCFISKDFNIVLFELNANMNVLIGASKNTSYFVEKIKKAVCDMIIKKDLIKIINI